VRRDRRPDDDHDHDDERSLPTFLVPSTGSVPLLKRVSVGVSGPPERVSGHARATR
jgi:hypothetical protein